MFTKLREFLREIMGWKLFRPLQGRMPATNNTFRIAGADACDGGMQMNIRFHFLYLLNGILD
jgi:hypothetical protein